MKKWLGASLILTALVVLAAMAVQAKSWAPAGALGTAFTYQGQLNVDGQPVDNVCDFQFGLYDDDQGLVQIGATLPISGVVVSEGLFTTQLDFGAGAFAGDARWLGIEVQCQGDAATTDLGLQALTAAPYALYAMSVPWGGIGNVPAGFADGVDDVSAVVSGTAVYAGEGLNQISGGDAITLSVASSYRLPQTCTGGQIAEWDGATWICGDDDAAAGDYQNVVVVAKSGGDFTTIRSAIASISDASADNAYLVWVAPGVYNEEVTMKPHIHLQGAGQAATVISSTAGSEAFPPTEATLVLTRNVTLRDLTVINNDGNALNTSIALMAPAGVIESLVADVNAQAVGHTTENYAVHVMGIGSGGAITLTLQNVEAFAENASDVNTGLHNYYRSTLILRGGTFTGRGGDSAYGITTGADETSLIAENVIAHAEDAGYNYGLTNGEGVASLLGGTFSAKGGDVACGIYNFTGSYLETESVLALGQDGTNSRGLENAMAQAVLYGGSFSAFGGNDARGIYNRLNTGVLQATAVTALGQDSVQFNYGLYNEDEAEAYLQGGAYTGRGGTSSYGLCNRDENTFLETHAVAALGENSSIGNRGLYNTTDARALLYGGSFVGHSGGTGITNYEAVLEANDVYALGEGDNSYTSGLTNTANEGASATAILRGGSFIARDASDRARGIYAWGDSMTLEANGILAMAEDGDENYGLAIDKGIAGVTQSTLIGSTNAAYRNTTGGSVLTISNSRLEGGDVFGTVTCVAVTWGTTFYETTCP